MTYTRVLVTDLTSGESYFRTVLKMKGYYQFLHKDGSYGGTQSFDFDVDPRFVIKEL